MCVASMAEQAHTLPQQVLLRISVPPVRVYIDLVVCAHVSIQIICYMQCIHSIYIYSFMYVFKNMQKKNTDQSPWNDQHQTDESDTRSSG